MSNIYFNSIKLNKFMSYDQEEFYLNRNGYILISGQNNNIDDNSLSNGSGKSSLFSALCWCLTGETPSGNKKVENIYLTGQTFVEVNFNIDDNNYIIKRCKNPSNLYIEINGENKSGKGIRDGEKLLAEYIPEITSSLINSVIILGQGLPQRFSNNTPSGRKEVLEKLSNSDFMISDLKNRLGSRKDKLDSLLLSYNNKKIETVTRLDILQKTIESYIKKLNSINISELEIKLDELRDKKLILDKDIDSYKSAKEESEILLNQRTSELNSIKKDYENEFNSLNLIPEKELEEYISLIAHNKAILKYNQSEILKLESVKDICPTCGQKIPGVVKLDTSSLKEECNSISNEISQLENSLNEKKKINTTLIEELNNIYNEKERTIEQDIKTIKSDVNNFSNILNDKELKSKILLEEIIEAETNFNNIHNIIENLTSDIDTSKKEYNDLLDSKQDIESQIEHLQTRLDIISKMKTLVTRDFRGYLLSSIIEFIANKIKVYSLKVFGTDHLEFKLDGNNILISYDNKEYESLSGGEKQKVDIIVQLALRDMLCNYLNFSSNILVLDEITDSLDIVGSQNILNLISSELQDVEAIYIISHHTDFDIPWDDEIIVVKDENKISRIIN